MYVMYLEEACFTLISLCNPLKCRRLPCRPFTVQNMDYDQIRSHYISSSHTRPIRCLTLRRIHLP